MVATITKEWNMWEKWPFFFSFEDTCSDVKSIRNGRQSAYMSFFFF